MLNDSTEARPEGSPQASEVIMHASQALAAYNIPDSRIPDLRTKVERLARRAAKLGMPAISLVEVKPGPRTKERWSEAKRRNETYILPCTWCELRGPSPVLSGYTFLARLEHTDAGNLVSRVPGAGDEIDLTAWRTALPHCDHCKHKRKRNDTFVLLTPEGSLTQIGRNCLADYIRSANVDVVLAMIDLTHELSKSAEEDEGGDGEGGYGGGYREVLLVRDYVAATVVAVREFGWVSRSAVNAGVQKTPTATHASFIAGRAPSENRAAEEWRRLQPTKEDVEYADRVLEWLKGTTDASDYMYNLRVAAALPEVTYRTRGLLASVVGAYQREVEKKIAQRSVPKVSAHVGEVGQRLTFRVTLVRKADIDTQWGGLAIHVLEDENGNLFVWKTGTGSLKYEITYDVKGTIKKHSEYKGKKQTELSRCIATEVPRAAKESKAC